MTAAEELNLINYAFGCGYELGLVHGRLDRLEDERQAAIHDLACRTIGLTPHEGPPLWAVEA